MYKAILGLRERPLSAFLQKTSVGQSHQKWAPVDERTPLGVASLKNGKK